MFPPCPRFHLKSSNLGLWDLEDHCPKMPLQISQIELSQAYSGSIATRNVEKSLNKIATGKKAHADGDSAAYAQSLRMESQQKHGLNNLQNIQI